MPPEDATHAELLARFAALEAENRALKATHEALRSQAALGVRAAKPMPFPFGMPAQNDPLWWVFAVLALVALGFCGTGWEVESGAPRGIESRSP